MEAYTKFMGKTVEDAVQEACIELGTTSDNLDYRVIVHETKGFLGFGAKQAVIEARKKMSDEDIFEEMMKEDKDNKKSSARGDRKANRKAEKSNKPEEKEEKEAFKSEKKKEKAQEKEEKKNVKAEKKAEKKAEVKKEEPSSAEQAVKDENPEASEEVLQKPDKADAAPAEEKKKREDRVPADPEVAKKRAEDFLTKTFEAMGLDVDIDMSFEDDTLSIDLSGDDMGILIGKRGQTLDSVQYLTSLVVNKGKASYVRVKVDTENYRERRKATLENLARNIAFKVKKTRRSIYLEPMNPYERRIIHSTLQSDPYVTTHSEGEEPLRKVVVTLKKKEFD